MKTTPIMILVLALLLSSTALADEKQAAEGTAATTDQATVEKIDPAKMNGKELFRTYCKGCHAAKSEYGEYTPMSLIMDQWDEFYDETLAETHKELSDEVTGGKPLPEFLTKDMIKKLRKFCVDHAADSEQPMTCG